MPPSRATTVLCLSTHDRRRLASCSPLSALHGRIERPAPLLPSHFDEILSAKQFDERREGADLPLISNLYAATFREHFKRVTTLDYGHRGWRDDEAVKLSKLLVGGYVPLLSSLILRRNAIGDDGASTLMRLLSSAWEAGAPG